MRIVVILMAVSMCCDGAIYATATSYYVSRSAGDDSASGTSSRSPWKTLARASEVDYQPGDQILLKAGDVWQETFTCRGDGTQQRPIVLSLHGKGRMPRIEGGNRDDSICIYSEGVSHWEIRGLELSNAEYGIVLDGRKSQGKKGITIEGCYFHDLKLNGDFRRNKVDGPTWGGSIQVWSHQTLSKDIQGGTIRVDDVIVRSCISQNCDGFFFQRHNDGEGVMGLYGNVLIDGCTIKGHPANTVMLLGFMNDEQEITQTIRKCVFSDNGGQRHMPWGGTDVMMASAQHAVIEDSEFAGRKAFGKDPDGCALDYEGNVRDSIIRRCDIHSNRSGALLVMHYKDFFDVGIVDCLLRHNGSSYKRYELWVNSATVTGPIKGNTYYLLPGTKFLSRNAKLTVENNVAGAKEHVATPMANLPEGTYKKALSVVLSCQTEGATIRYTTDGSYPGNDAKVYKRPISITKTTALNAKAYKAGMERSFALSNIYVICAP